MPRSARASSSMCSYEAISPRVSCANACKRTFSMRTPSSKISSPIESTASNIYSSFSWPMRSSNIQMLPKMNLWAFYTMFRICTTSWPSSSNSRFELSMNCLMRWSVIILPRRGKKKVPTMSLQSS